MLVVTISCWGEAIWLGVRGGTARNSLDAVSEGRGTVRYSLDDVLERVGVVTGTWVGV